MAELKAGTRMKSAVCATQVMVIAAARPDVALTCGGVPMIGMNEEPAGGASIDAEHAAGTLLGKRYVNEAGDLEVLCTKPGDGALAADGELLVLKEAKALPSSD
ncbi:MAG: hypothetical protein KDI01_09275 [Halioglobus sp.]|nr:hypothetical protein [Halioglobus sp.]